MNDEEFRTAVIALLLSIQSLLVESTASMSRSEKDELIKLTREKLDRLIPDE